MFRELYDEVKYGVMRFAQEVKPASWLDVSFGCCLLIW